MKIRKSIAYAYPTSSRSAFLGKHDTGCWYVAQSILKEDSTWSEDYPAQGSDTFDYLGDPELWDLFLEHDGDICPYMQRSAKWDECKKYISEAKERRCAS